MQLGVPEKVIRRIEREDPSVSVRSLMLVLWNLSMMEGVFQSFEETQKIIHVTFNGRLTRRLKIISCHVVEDQSHFR